MLGDALPHVGQVRKFASQFERDAAAEFVFVVREAHPEVDGEALAGPIILYAGEPDGPAVPGLNLGDLPWVWHRRCGSSPSGGGGTSPVASICRARWTIAWCFSMAAKPF